MLVCCVISRRHLPRPSPDTYKSSDLAQFWCNLTPFRINTCKSVSKQTTLSPFRINTYEKTGGGGPYKYISVAAPSSIFRTHFQVPYRVTPLFATLTKTAGVCTQNSRSGTPLVLAGERTEMYSGAQSLRPRNNPWQSSMEKKK
jgi:hypothetical protein